MCVACPPAILADAQAAADVIRAALARLARRFTRISSMLLNGSMRISSPRLVRPCPSSVQAQSAIENVVRAALVRTSSKEAPFAIRMTSACGGVAVCSAATGAGHAQPVTRQGPSDARHVRKKACVMLMWARPSAAVPQPGTRENFPGSHCL